MKNYLTIRVALFFLLIGLLFFDVSAQSQIVSKSCGRCGGSVSLSAQVGDKCPHCGVSWGRANSSTTNLDVPTHSPQTESPTPKPQYEASPLVVITPSKPEFDVGVYIMGVVLFLIVAIAMGVIAHNKGFNPACWIFAGGSLGLIVLLSMTSANNVQNEGLKQIFVREGNTAGLIITSITALLIFIMLMS